MIDTEAQQRLFTVERDMVQVGTLVDRLDTTIEKLTEVSTTVSQLLAVQGNRLAHQEKIGEKLQDLVEQRRVETEVYVKDLYRKIEKVEEDLQAEFEESHKTILSKIEELQIKSTTQHKDLSDRFGRSEKWMYLSAGGGAVVLWLLNHLEVINAFK